MKAALLCAGFGTRLYPLTRHSPKPLLPVAGTPIVERLVRQLDESAAIEEIVVVCNGRFVERFDAWSERVRPTLAHAALALENDGATANEHRLGAVRDLAWCVERRTLDDGPLLVAAGDNLFDGAIEHLLADHRSDPRTLIVRYHEPDLARLRRTGVAEVDGRGQLVRLVEKPVNPPTSWAVPALYVLEPAALALLGPFLAERPEVDAIGHFIAWLARHHPVHTHEMRGRRLDVGDPESYRQAETWLGDGAHRS